MNDDLQKLQLRVRQGLEKLAFGSINDAVKLLFLDNPDPASLQSLDLFSVSELRRPKGGGMEIKFVDRMLALQRLNDLATPYDNPQQQILPFYHALQNLSKGKSS